MSQFKGAIDGSNNMFRETLVIFNYGWNSQNDNLFPTKGPEFITTLSFGKNISNDNYDMDVFEISCLGYNKHWALNDRNVFTLKLDYL